MLICHHTNIARVHSYVRTFALYFSFHVTHSLFFCFLRKQIIIRPEDTRDGPFESNSASFLFDPQQGFKPIQLQVRELDELKVRTVF